MKIIIAMLTILMVGGCANKLKKSHSAYSNKSKTIIASNDTDSFNNQDDVSSITKNVIPETRSVAREYSCKELTKVQAYSLMNSGHTYLDKDSDGHPCEWGKESSFYTPSYKSNCHYVSGYRRKNGTYVRGYTRCR